MIMKDTLFGKTLSELQEITENLGLPKYNARQISDWLYKKNIISVNEMTNLSVKTRELLSNKYDTGITLPLKVEVSADKTKKYLFQLWYKMRCL